MTACVNPLRCPRRSLSILRVCLLFLAAALAAPSAETQTWKPLGPDGGDARWQAILPGPTSSTSVPPTATSSAPRMEASTGSFAGWQVTRTTLSSQQSSLTRETPIFCLLLFGRAKSRAKEAESIAARIGDDRGNLPVWLATRCALLWQRRLIRILSWPALSMACFVRATPAKIGR